MGDWPASWAGVPDDERIGAALLPPMRDFLESLAAHGLARSTLRRHRDNLWVIGGEIIRAVHDDERSRRRPPRSLLLQAIDDGQAPYVAYATEAEQRGFDATARKLLRFMLTTTPGA